MLTCINTSNEATRILCDAPDRGNVWAALYGSVTATWKAHGDLKRRVGDYVQASSGAHSAAPSAE